MNWEKTKRRIRNGGTGMRRNRYETEWKTRNETECKTQVCFKADRMQNSMSELNFIFK